MNSIVVLLSVVALAASAPSVLQAPLLTYAAPASSGYISQSRIDVQSSPLLTSSQYAPVSRTVITGPAYVEGPAAISIARSSGSAYTQESRVDIKSSPAIVRTVASSPVSYSAPVAAFAAPDISSAIASPAASSYQTRVDFKSSPAVVNTYQTGPLAYSAPALAVAPATIARPIASSYESRIDVKSTPTVISTVKTTPVSYTAPVVSASPAAVVTPNASPCCAPFSESKIETDRVGFRDSIAPPADTVTSQQSRIEYKSSPAVVTVAEAPVVYNTAIAAPTRFTAPAASYQSRVEYKSSPAVVSTVAAAPVTYNAAIATPAAIAAPAAFPGSARTYQSQVEYKSSPTVVKTISSTPIAYNAPITGPASFLQQSRVDIKSSPGSVSSVVTAPVAYSATAYRTPIATYDSQFTGISSGVDAHTLIRNDNIARGIIAGSTYPAEPCATRAALLDTPEVAAVRAAHFEAEALAQGHLIHKRSAQVLAAPVISTYASTPIISKYSTGSLGYSIPFATSYSAPLITSLRSW